MNNRILAMLLAIIMVISMVPVNAFATEPSTHICADNLGTLRTPIAGKPGYHHADCTKCDALSEYPCTFGDDSKCDYCGYIKEHTCVDKNYDHLCDVGCGKVVHAMSKVEAKDPTHTETGNIEYWVCGTCTNYFEDEAGTQKILDKSSVIVGTVDHDYTASYTKGDENNHEAFCACGAGTVLPHVDDDSNCVCDACERELKHELIPVGATAPVCGTSGEYPHYRCAKENCDAYFNGAGQICEAEDIVHTLATTEHNLVYVWNADEHWKECANDGCDYVEESTKAAHGTFTYASQGADKHQLTCDTCGKSDFTWEDHRDDDKNCKCDDCGADVKHANIEFVEKQAAVCGTPGWKAHYECKGCGDLFWDESGTNPATAETVALKIEGEHNWVVQYDADSHWNVCNRCGTVDQSSDTAHNLQYARRTTKQHDVSCKDCEWVGTPADHIDTKDGGDCKCDDCGTDVEHVNIVPVEAQAAVCGTPGWVAHYKCEACGDLFEDENGEKPTTAEAVALKIEGEHNWVVQYDADSHWNVCNRCGTVDQSSDTAHKLVYERLGNKRHSVSCEDCDWEGEPADHKDIKDGGDCKCDDCNADVAHVNIVPVEAKAPKCGEPGWVAHYKCDGCGDLFWDAEGVWEASNETVADIITGEHRWVTVNNAEYHWTACNRCGTVDEATKAQHTLKYTSRTTTQHDVSCEYCEWTGEPQNHKDDVAPFCKCDDCGRELAHNGVYVEEVKPTCTTDGHTDYYLCSKCNVKYLSNGQEIDPFREKLDHDWGTARQLADSVYHSWHCQRPGCTGAKIELHVDKNDDCVCDTCGAFAHGAIKYMEPVAATCTTPGRQGYYYYDGCGKKFVDAAGTTILTEMEIYAELGHDYNGEWEPCDDGENHEKVCAREGCDVVVATEAHDFSSYAPNCTKCGTPEGMTHVPAVAATCTKPGNKEYWISSVTGRSYWDVEGKRPVYDVNELRTTLDHKMVVEAGNGRVHPMVCEYGCGYTYNVECKSKDDPCVCGVCGETLYNHVPVAYEYIAPTCYEEGQRDAVYCPGCDEYKDAAGNIMETIVIAMVPHEWAEEWTADGEGNHYKECLNEGCDYIQEGPCESTDDDCICDECDEILLGHEPETIEYIAPTCDEEGQLAAVYCPACDEYKDEEGNVLETIVIPELGHDWDEMHMEDGEHYRECKRTDCDAKETAPCESKDKDCFCDECGYSLPGHTFVEYKYIAPTCTKPGQMAAVYCETCKQYYETEEYEIVNSIVLNALGHDWSGEWYNDTREVAHSKDCQRNGCNVKLTMEHELTCESVNKGNMHEWSCSICGYQKSGVHADNDGDTICDECDYESNKVVSGSSLNNPRDVVTIKGDEDATTQEKKNTWWKDFVGKLNPSYVGESQSSSAPSASVGSSSTNGSGSTVSGSVNSGAGSSSTGSSAVDAVITFLMNLLNALLGN